MALTSTHHPSHGADLHTPSVPWRWPPHTIRPMALTCGSVIWVYIVCYWYNLSNIACRVGCCIQQLHIVHETWHWIAALLCVPCHITTVSVSYPSALVIRDISLRCVPRLESMHGILQWDMLNNNLSIYCIAALPTKRKQYTGLEQACTLFEDIKYAHITNFEHRWW